MKAIIFLTIFIALASAGWPKIEYTDYSNDFSSSDYATKIGELSIRSWNFESSSQQFSTLQTETDEKKKPSNYYFNISVQKTPMFVVNPDDIEKSTYAQAGIWIGIDQIQKNLLNLTTKDTWTIIKEDDETNNATVNLGHDLIQSTTLEYDIKKWYSCAYYQIGSSVYKISDTNKYEYELKGCTDFETDLSESNQYQNFTVKYENFGTSYISIKQQYRVPNHIPQYIKSVKVNKIRGLMATTTNDYYKLQKPSIKVELNSPYITFKGLAQTGLIDYVYNGGKSFIIDLSISFNAQGLQAISTGGLVNINLVNLAKYSDYDATLGSDQQQWARMLTSGEQITEGLYSCGQTRWYFTEHIDIELTIECSSGVLLKVSLLIFGAIAGLFMMN